MAASTSTATAGDAVAVPAPDGREVLCLFDVDGTLSLARKSASAEMHAFLQRLRKKAVVGVVGGSDFPKQQEQLGENVLSLVDYSFSENGLVAYRDGQKIHEQTLKNHFGNEVLIELINFCLHYIADLKIPVKRGTFVEFRTGMLNVSPIGRNCSYEERLEFEAYDKIHGIRKQMVAVLEDKFAHMNLRFVIGGQISFDVFPKGWDKTYCLRHVAHTQWKAIHFFGDKTKPGENDYEIFTHPSVQGHTVLNPDDTLRQLKELFPDV